jgi:hypothetical protein
MPDGMPLVWQRHLSLDQHSVDDGEEVFGRPRHSQYHVLPNHLLSPREPTRAARKSAHVRCPMALSGFKFAPARNARAALPGIQSGTIIRRLPRARRSARMKSWNWAARSVVHGKPKLATIRSAPALTRNS